MVYTKHTRKFEKVEELKVVKTKIRVKKMLVTEVSQQCAFVAFSQYT